MRARGGATVRVGDVTFGADRLVLIAGPCVIESRDSALRHAEAVRRVTDRLGVPFVYKSSFDKANRSAGGSFRGPGMEAGVEILAAVRREIGVPVLTDVHETRQVDPVAAVVDVLQIPAFLCRQTDLILAAARTGRVVNLKKGQFLSPWEMRYAIDKARSAGGEGKVLVTERGTTFGYNNLVTDFRALVVMGGFGVPVVYDATHSVQLPGAGDGVSEGQRQFVPALARAAVAVGVDGLFMEVHADPREAKSDAATAFPLARLEGLLAALLALDQARRARRGDDDDA